MIMDTKPIVLVLVTMATVFHCVAMTSASKSHRKCPVGVEYYNREQKACVPCSNCTGNTVPHRQCHGNQDTLCLPLGRFNFPHSRKKVAESSKPEQSSVITLKTAPETRQETATTLLMADESSDEKWFTITMVLAGIMVVVCIAGAFLLLFTCYICKKKQREIIYDSTFAASLLSYDGNPQGKTELCKIVTET